MKGKKSSLGIQICIFGLLSIFYGFFYFVMLKCCSENAEQTRKDIIAGG